MCATTPYRAEKLRKIHNDNENEKMQIMALNQRLAEAFANDQSHTKRMSAN